MPYDSRIVRASLEQTHLGTFTFTALTPQLGRKDFGHLYVSCKVLRAPLKYPTTRGMSTEAPALREAGGEHWPQVGNHCRPWLRRPGHLPRKGYRARPLVPQTGTAICFQRAAWEPWSALLQPIVSRDSSAAAAGANVSQRCRPQSVARERSAAAHCCLRELEVCQPATIIGRTPGAANLAADFSISELRRAARPQGLQTLADRTCLTSPIYPTCRWSITQSGITRGTRSSTVTYAPRRHGRIVQVVTYRRQDAPAAHMREKAECVRSSGTQALRWGAI
jgi:hypothetical protein